VSAETGNRPAGAGATPTKDNRLLFLAMAVLALAGLAVSAVSLQRHYAKSATAFCDVGERFNCDIVNRSEYSSVVGIPVAGIGIVGYGVLLALATLYRSGGDANALAGCGGRRVGIRSISDVCRGVCAGNLVHSVLRFAGADCDDHRAGGSGKGQVGCRGLKVRVQIIALSGLGGQLFSRSSKAGVVSYILSPPPGAPTK